MKNPRAYMEAERTRIAADLADHEARYPETNALVDQVMAEIHAREPRPDCPGCAVAALSDADRFYLTVYGWVQPLHTI